MKSLNKILVRPTRKAQAADIVKNLEKSVKKEKNPINEIAIFSIGFGVIIGIGAFFAITKLGTSPELWGFERNIAIGVPSVVIAVAHIFSGTMLLLTKSKWAIVAAIFSAFIMAGFYFIFETSTIGFLKAKLMSVLAYALPIFLIIRGKVAMSQIDSSRNSPKINPNET